MSLSSSTQTIHFLDLVEDVISQILCFCDISRTISSSQTCRKLYALAFTKHVWLALMQDLEARKILDVPLGQSLRDFSVLELVDLAKRTARGPETWSPQSDPVVSREIILHPDIPHGDGILYWENEAKLLPGGKWVLFSRWQCLECWNVAEDKLVWTHHSQHKHAAVVDFSAELVDGGQAVVIFVGLRTYTRVYESRSNIVEIVHLDLQLGTSITLLSQRTIKTDHDNAFRNSIVCGDYAATCILSSHHILVLNWKLGLSLLIKTPKPTSDESFCDSDLTLIPGHLLVASPNVPQSATSVLIWDLNSFANHWSSVDEMEQCPTVAIRDLSDLACHTINLRVPLGLTDILLSALESPLRDGLYTVWVYMSHHQGCTVSRCTLALPPLQKSSLRLQRSTSALGEVGIHRKISYAGHSIVWNHILSCGGELGDQVDVKLRGCGDFIHLSAYSGALTFSTRDSIVIKYYK